MQELIASSSDESPGTWLLVGPSVTHHQQRTHAKRPYNENNPGLGIEYRRPLSDPAWRAWDWGVQTYAVKDSFAQPALFVMGSLTREVVRIGPLQFRLGAQAGLAYKHVDWQRANLVPVAALLASMKWRDGLTLNLSYAHATNATTGRAKGVTALQLAYQFK
ncbi:hypothetical protein ACG0Z6_15925 [Roseateles sp. BYS180W]|uniref:Acyloxyacyl hydrolase n=1 Tax=Roseateles rivi TaxID=3299028 RepID=A0ABW7FZC0_9BURK